jgi:hypothetical protein
MSREKLHKVVSFAKPRVSKELKSFLGLANYFRDHIRNHALIVKPLQALLLGYKKHKPIQWTEEANQAFLNIKNQINDCPTLFFVNDTAPIFLHTDASKFAIGGYIFQIVDGKEEPIGFHSHTLSASEVRWSTYEKEAYAYITASNTSITYYARESILP